jgi:hypothetical protein
MKFNLTLVEEVDQETRLDHLNVRKAIGALQFSNKGRDPTLQRRFQTDAFTRYLEMRFLV